MKKKMKSEGDHFNKWLIVCVFYAGIVSFISGIVGLGILPTLLLLSPVLIMVYVAIKP